LHQVPTPRTGGLAILGSVVIGLVVSAPVLGLARSSIPEGSLWIIGSIVLVGAMSFLDDRIALPASRRFALQAIAALMVVLGAGLTLSSVSVPMVGTVSFGWMAEPISVVFLLWMMNLYNFMDGMDGFAGGMSVLGFGFLACFGWMAGHPVIFLVATLVAVIALGFLIHNFPPARIFMGDVGSITLGLLAGTLMLLGVRDGVFEVWVPGLVFAPFIVDATITVLRRGIEGATIWEAHRTHYYQRLVLHGWGHRKTVLVEYGLMLVCGAAALAYHRASEPGRLVVLAVMLGVFAALAVSVRLMEGRLQAAAHTTSSARDTASPNRPIA
jgi:UDP-N-acetylmuramyl pentapeptide phosphotransferase/UDP-N-acetylglucosamine-1-phosphate transferase